MTETFDTNILICHAGTTGLTLAIGYARRNIAFRILEQMDSPFLGSRASGVQPRCQEIFEDLGIADRPFMAGGVHPPERQHCDDGSFAKSVVVDLTDATPVDPDHTARLVNKCTLKENNA